MKLSEIYRTAAKRVEDGKNNYCCYAINDVLGLHFTAEPEAYRRIKATFGPQHEPYCGGWWGCEDGTGDATAARILALCFMAAIASDEERGKSGPLGNRG